MPIKETAKEVSAKITAALSPIGRYVRRISAPLRYRLARAILRTRSFWLFLACQSWAFLLLFAWVMAQPQGALVAAKLFWLRKLSALLGFANGFGAIHDAAKKRWRKLRR